MTPWETWYVFHGIEIVTTKIVYSKSLKRICHQLLWMMNILKLSEIKGHIAIEILL